MTLEEEPLAGGNATAGVVRVGDTVRKPWSASTPAVHRFVARLHERGVDVPDHGGPDRTGHRRGLPNAMAARAGAMHRHLVTAHAAGWQPWADMYSAGHGDHWGSVAAFTAEHRDDWARALG